MQASNEFKEGKHGIGYVTSSFASRFSDQTFELVSAPPRAIKLSRSMSDVKIESELKPGFCTLGDVLAVLDSDDEEYRDGNWNLFYFEACVVGVCWDGGGWSVHAWRRDDDGWLAGGRVFSPATVTHVSMTLQHSDTLTLGAKEMQFDYIELVKTGNREVVCIGIAATEENKQFLKDILGEKVVIKKALNN